MIALVAFVAGAVGFVLGVTFSAMCRAGNLWDGEEQGP